VRQHLVVGAGEVGRAIAEVLDCEARDVDGHRDEKVGTLHIAFGWSDSFVAAVIGYRDRYRPDLVVIHSTVPVGTSRRLDAVHSPVRGRHPHLADSLRTFVKFVAGPGADNAAEQMNDHGVDTVVVPDQETTEAGKLWELLMFGLAVAQQKEMYRWCEERGADPAIAYAQFAETYNDGYERLGLPQLRRRIITPTAGQIGGHCVIPMSELVDHELAELLLKLNASW
jgi:hypothetical protein